MLGIPCITLSWLNEGRKVDAQKILTTDVLMTNKLFRFHECLNYVKAGHQIMEELTVSLRDVKKLDAHTGTKFTFL